MLASAAALVLAAALLAPAMASVGEVLAANRWKLPVPDLEILKGPEDAPAGKVPDGNVGEDPPPPPQIVRTTTTITASPERIDKGTPFLVEGDVLDEDGDGVEGAPIDLYLNETKTQPGFRVAKGRTDEDGHWAIRAEVPSHMAAREYQIVATTRDSLKGRVLYLESWSDPPTAVYSDTRIRFFAPSHAVAGEEVFVEGTLTDVTNGPVREVTVHLLVDDRQVATTITDGQGWFRMKHVFLAPGKHTVAVWYPGSTYYGESMAEREIDVSGKGHEVDTPSSVLRNSTLELAGRVKLDDGSPAGYRVVVAFEDLTFDGESTFEFLTDAAGEWSSTLFVPRETPIGRYTVVYTVPALGVEDRKTLSVGATTWVELETPARVPVDGPLEARATLRDDLGEPLYARELVLETAGRSVEAWTDENGTAAWSLDVPGGEHAARVDFRGDGLLRPSADETSYAAELSFFEAARPWILWILLAAALIAGGVWAAKNRRRIRSAAAALDPREPVLVTIDLPSVEPDLPDVWGVGEALPVVVRAATKDGAPLPSLPLTVEAGGPVKTTTDATGRHRTEVTFAAEGVAPLAAAYAGDRRRRPAEIVREVRIVEYRRVIEEGFEELRRTLAAHGVPVHDSTPPRELERRLQGTAPALAPDDLDRLLTLFEVSDYSERPIGRDEWVVFHRTRSAVEAALAATGRAPALPSSPAPAPQEEATHAA